MTKHEIWKAIETEVKRNRAILGYYTGTPHNTEHSAKREGNTNK